VSKTVTTVGKIVFDPANNSDSKLVELETRIKNLEDKYDKLVKRKNKSALGRRGK
jgi:hypothetical protein